MKRLVKPSETAFFERFKKISVMILTSENKMNEANFVEYVKSAMEQLLPDREIITRDATESYQKGYSINLVNIRHDHRSIVHNDEILAGVELILPNALRDDVQLSYMSTKETKDPWKLYRDIRTKVAKLSDIPEDRIAMNFSYFDMDNHIKIYILKADEVPV